MKKITSYFLLICISIWLGAQPVQAQVDVEKLYNKSWRTKLYEIIKPNSTVVIYSRYENKGSLNYSSSVTLFRRDGSIEGFNAGGYSAPGKYKLLPNNEILFDNETVPTRIVKLTDAELITEASQLYKPILTSEPYNIIVKIYYEVFEPCTVYESLRSGSWNDPAIWTCQKVPSADNLVQINEDHEVTIPDNYKAYAKLLKQVGKLKLGEGAKLEFSRNP